VGLYEVPEKPPNAIKYASFTHGSLRLTVLFSCTSSFMKEYLGASVGTDIEKLKATIEKQNKMLAEKDAQIAALQKQVNLSTCFRVTRCRHLCFAA
jgi:hypothetical protein